MNLVKDSPIPLYYQIREILRKEILESELPHGSSLPSESDLMERFSVSRATVRRAMQDLVQEGLVYRLRGRGAFVRSLRIVQELTALTGFVEDMLELGHRPLARLVKAEQVPANETVAAKLNLPIGETVTYIERVRLANEIPLSFDTTWLPNDLGQKIVQDNLDIYPIYSLLEDKYGILLGNAQYVIDAAVAEATLARILNIDEGAPIFIIERTAQTTEGIPIDFEMLHYRADRIRFALQLNRKRPTWRLDVLDELIRP